MALSRDTSVNPCSGQRESELPGKSGANARLAKNWTASCISLEFCQFTRVTYYSRPRTCHSPEGLRVRTTFLEIQLRIRLFSFSDIFLFLFSSGGFYMTLFARQLINPEKYCPNRDIYACIDICFILFLFFVASSHRSG